MVRMRSRVRIPFLAPIYFSDMLAIFTMWIAVLTAKIPDCSRTGESPHAATKHCE